MIKKAIILIIAMTLFFGSGGGTTLPQQSRQRIQKGEYTQDVKNHGAYDPRTIELIDTLMEHVEGFRTAFVTEGNDPFVRDNLNSNDEQGTDIRNDTPTLWPYTETIAAYNSVLDTIDKYAHEETFEKITNYLDESYNNLLRFRARQGRDGERILFTNTEFGQQPTSISSYAVYPCWPMERNTASEYGVEAFYDDNIWIVKELFITYKNYRKYAYTEEDIENSRKYLYEAMNILNWIIVEGYEQRVSASGNWEGVPMNGIHWLFQNQIGAEEGWEHSDGSPYTASINTCSTAPTAMMALKIADEIYSDIHLLTKPAFKRIADEYLEKSKKIVEFADTVLRNSDGLYADNVSLGGTGDEAYIAGKHGGALGYNVACMTIAELELFKATNEQKYFDNAWQTVQAFAKWGNYDYDKDAHRFGRHSWFTSFIVDALLEMYEYNGGIVGYILEYLNSFNYALQHNKGTGIRSNLVSSGWVEGWREPTFENNVWSWDDGSLLLQAANIRVHGMLTKFLIEHEGEFYYQRIEAENAIDGKGFDEIRRRSGNSKGGYGYRLRADEYAVYELEVPKTGVYAVQLRYATNTDGAIVKYSVKGSGQGEFICDQRFGWDNYNAVSEQLIAFYEGKNYLQLIGIGREVSIDYFAIFDIDIDTSNSVPDAEENYIRYEVEEIKHKNSSVKLSSNASRGGYAVSNEGGAELIFNINVDESGQYKLRIGYASFGTTSKAEAFLLKDMHFDRAGSINTIYPTGRDVFDADSKVNGSVMLRSGDNTVKIKIEQADILLDYVEVYSIKIADFYMPDLTIELADEFLIYNKATAGVGVEVFSGGEYGWGQYVSLIQDEAEAYFVVTAVKSAIFTIKIVYAQNSQSVLEVLTSHGSLEIVELDNVKGLSRFDSTVEFSLTLVKGENIIRLKKQQGQTINISSLNLSRTFTDYEQASFVDEKASLPVDGQLEYKVFTSTNPPPNENKIHLVIIFASIGSAAVLALGVIIFIKKRKKC